ncbi:MAG: cellulase family glycosylhydrolase [Paracoccaceae bacterium]
MESDGMNMYQNNDLGTGANASGDGQTYAVGSTDVITGFDPSKDVLDLGTDSIHNQIGVDTAEGFAMLHMFDGSKSTLLEGVYLKDLSAGNFAPIADAHLQQDLSAALAYENGTGLVRGNTVYVRSHEAGLEEVVDFNPATDKISMFYLSVRGDQKLNFVAEDTAEGARFFSPITGQSLTLRGVSMTELDSSHFEWRANQLEDNVAGRMGLADEIAGFTYENIYSGKSVAMAGLVDRAPYHSQPEYTGTPIAGGSGGDTGGEGTGDDTGGSDNDAPIGVTVTVTGGSVTEGDPGMPHMHGDGTSHTHDDGHRYIVFNVSLDAPAAEELTLNYATTDGLAVADATNSVAWDYHEKTGTLVFAPGEQTKAVSVAVHPDDLVELTETFTLKVSGENITGDLVATGIIYDNDKADPTDGDMGGGDTGGDGAPNSGAFVPSIASQWGEGFVVETTFTPTEAVDGWTVQMRIPGEITNIWNADIVSRDGDVYTLTSKTYNASVAAGQSIGFGFQVAGPDTSITVIGQDSGGGDPGGDMGDGGDMGSDTGGDHGGGDMGDGGDTGGDGSPSAGAFSPSISSQWGSGYNVETTFAPEEAVDGWTVQMRIPGEIVNIWNADIVSQDGDVYTLTSKDYNAKLAAGQAISFGFQVQGTDANIEVIGQDNTDTGGDTGGDTDGNTGSDNGGDTDADTGGDTGGSGNDGGKVGGGDILNGPLSTLGTDIVDADGMKVDLKGVNWFGFETDIGVLHGLWARNMEDMLDEIADFGFNMIRLPFAGELAVNDTIASGINTAENPVLAGMTSLEVMGEFLDAAAERGFGVLLDMHRTTPGNGPEGGGRIPDVDSFLDQWATIAETFGDHPAVIGFDLYNEPHGYTWEEWAPIAEQAGNMLLESHPDELIIVEGVETYQGESHWWGGNLQGVADRPVILSADDKLVYSPHEYATSVFEQPYFNEAGYDPETTLPGIFRENWGFIEEEGIAPLLLGEFGSTFDNQTDREWAPVLTDYLLENDIDWAIWSWNPNSGDTQGVVLDDWKTPRLDAFTYLLDPLLAEAPQDPVNDVMSSEDTMVL